MSRFALEEFEKIRDLLVRHSQLQKKVWEIDCQLENLRSEYEVAERELEAVESALSQQPAELVTVAKSLADVSLGLRKKGEEVKKEVRIENPQYVSDPEKRKLLAKILSDFQLNNPDAKGMTFQQILHVLETQYGIKTRTIGNFFKSQLEDYKTEGGNRLKYVLFPDLVIDDQPIELKSRHRSKTDSH